MGLKKEPVPASFLICCCCLVEDNGDRYPACDLLSEQRELIVLFVFPPSFCFMRLGAWHAFMQKGSTHSIFGLYVITESTSR